MTVEEAVRGRRIAQKAHDSLRRRTDVERRYVCRVAEHVCGGRTGLDHLSGSLRRLRLVETVRDAAADCSFAFLEVLYDEWNRSDEEAHHVS